ncbi:Crp/Fnr family transcriptional regulator [Maribacter sp. TH_r10]|uniref:Cyclic nucleotide-binding domain-containing protein n=1 Tax=Maribacter luteus TaxID=2594478 RepID=A0A6I2MQG9_9FLAO|nr:MULTISPECIES: Crp/Fnr family transcriptional regulator [Maribacter]MDV7140439.1 Crp/Fnr family transcriptional regulator [Maribacter sp. TH_r10]MRX64690.1 cyclic nucleotide-binding domain-containing protein [Maribacter luteus]
MKEFKLFLESLVPFTESEMQVLLSLFSEIQLKKKDYFAQEGEFSSKLAFVSSGVLRAFFRNKTGNEYNKTFFTPSNFVAAYSSITTKQKNLINIQCLTDCTLLVADFRQLTSLYKAYPKFESLARVMAEYKFSIKEKREIELVTLEATERYEIFKKEHPNLENLISQYHIASYLGITPTQLSRIRRQNSKS